MFDNEKILVVVDPTQNDTSTIDRAFASAKIRKNAEIHILYIIDNDAVDTSATNPHVYRDSQWFADNRAPLIEAGIDVYSQLCLSTEYHKAILNCAKQRNIDMILLPAGGDSESVKKSFSNQRWAILRKSECPVLLVKPGHEELRSVILAAVKIQNADEAQEALNERVLTRARWAADRYGATLHVVNAYKDSMDYPDRGVLARMANVPTEQIHVEEGAPEEVIAKVADSINSDAVVIGTNRREGLGELLRGNTSEKLLLSINQDIWTIN